MPLFRFDGNVKQCELILDLMCFFIHLSGGYMHKTLSFH